MKVGEDVEISEKMKGRVVLKKNRNLQTISGVIDKVRCKKK